MSLDISTSNWKWIKAKDFMIFNPRESVKKGTLVKNIPMDKIEPKTKEISDYEITEFKSGTKFRNGDTLMARITPCLENGKISQVNMLDDNEIGCGSTEFIVLREKENVSDKEFIYYLSQSEFFKEPAIKSMVGSSGRQRVQRDVIENLDIYVPPLEIQQKIGKLLSMFDQKISLNKKINKNLEQLLHTIFNHWFISFNNFKNVKFKQSPLGDIPDGWNCGTLRDLLTLTKNPIKADETNGLPYLPIDIIPMNSLGISELKSDEEANSSLITFNKNDILIGAMRVYFHRVVISPCSGVTRSTCFVLNPKQKHHLSYLLLLCNLDRTIQYAQNTSKGTTMPYAVWDNGLGDMDIIIPQDNILLEFHKLVFPIIEKIRDSYLEINKLSKLRDILLPKLMSGEIDVSKINY